jgi:hypothetical protein
VAALAYRGRTTGDTLIEEWLATTEGSVVGIVRQARVRATVLRVWSPVVAWNGVLASRAARVGASSSVSRES